MCDHKQEKDFHFLHVYNGPKKFPGIHGEGLGTGLPNDGDYSDIELKVLSFLKETECDHNPGTSCRDIMRAGSGHCCREYQTNRKET